MFLSTKYTCHVQTFMEWFIMELHRENWNVVVESFVQW